MGSSSKTEWNQFGRSNAARQWRRQSSAMGRHVTELIVAAANVEPGMHVLDVACGTGEPTISIARLLNGTGRVLGIDIAEEALKVARERAAHQQFTNVEFELADVHQLRFGDDTFDRITSRLGVMFFADLPRAAAEMRRVLKPNGKITLLTWGPMDQPYFDTMAGTVLRVLDAKPPDSAAKMFSFAIPGSLARSLEDAGFRAAVDKCSVVPWTWPGSPEEVWAYFQQVAVPFSPVVKAIPAELRSEVDRAVVAAIYNYYDGQEIQFTATVNVTSATK